MTRFMPVVRIVLALFLAASVAIGVILVGLPGNADQAFIDAVPPRAPTDSRVVVVGLDKAYLEDSSLPRGAEGTTVLVERLAAAGARVIVLTDEDSTVNYPTAVIESLADSVADAGNVVVPIGEYLMAPSRVAERAAAVGGLAPTADADGKVRSVQVVANGDTGRTAAPSATAAVLALMEGTRVVRYRPGVVEIGRYRIPVDNQGSMRLSLSSALVMPQGGHYVGASAVVRGKASKLLRGAVVFVGAPADDWHVVSYASYEVPASPDGQLSAVFASANALNTVLTGRFVRPVGIPSHVVLAVMMAAVGMAAGLWLRPARSLIAVGLTGALFAAVAFFLVGAGHPVRAISLLAVLAFVYVATLSFRLAGEERDRRRLVDVLTQYVPADEARAILAQGRTSDVPFGDVTFFFTDVVDASSGWELDSPGMASATARLDELVQEVFAAHGGALVQPRGEADSRFGIFPDPERAALAALQLQDKVRTERWASPIPIWLRIGLHIGTAPAAGGYYGSPASQCARIRSLATPGEVLASEAAAEVLRTADERLTVEPRGEHTLKGFDLPERIFAVRWAVV